jgi:hypothetical protein
MPPDPLSQHSHAIETVVTAATYPLLALLAVALVVVAIDAARDWVARRPRRRTSPAGSPLAPRRASELRGAARS